MPRKQPTIKGVGFEFVEDGHAYYLDGKKLTGVTTILGVIAKPMLIQWAANEAVKYVKEKFDNIIFPSKEDDGIEHVDCSYKALYEILDEAKVAHRKKKEDAGDKGKDVHSIIEGIIKSAILNTGGIINTGDIAQSLIVHDQVRHFISWAIENKVKFLASEEKIFSRELWLGGTVDFVCEIEGEAWIGDIKTSSGIYPEHFFQTAGYQKIMEDMAKTDGGMPLNVKGHVILNCRKDGSFEEKRSISNEDNRSAFLAALTLYRVQDKLKGTII